MLYLSTRNKTDSFTAFRAMHNDTTPDGGFYIPFRLASFTPDEITEIRNLAFGEAVAKILNLFFSEQLTGWDVDFCIGRTPVKLENIGHKTTVAELWHNHDHSYETIRNTLYSRIYSTSQTPSFWAKIAIDTAILFGVCTQMTDCESFDISLSEDKDSLILAAWYAKKLGLPIGCVLLTCMDQSTIYDFVRYGQIKTRSRLSVAEHILFDLSDFDTVKAYTNAKKTYHVDEELLPKVTDTLQAVVVGDDRAENIIQSIQRINGYHIDRDAAAAFGGLQDFRAQGGESKLTLLVSEVKPES